MLELNFSPFPAITTRRLILRQVLKTDVDQMYFLRSDERVLQFLDRLPIQSKEEALLLIEKFLELEKNQECITWAITLKPSNTLIGTICFWNIKKEHYRADVGYMLHPNFYRQGIMQEALREVINFGFSRLNLHSIQANVNPNNLPSIKLLERNKFIKEAHFKEDYFYNGKFVDTAIYSLLTPSTNANR